MNYYKDMYNFKAADLFAFYLRKSQADDPDEPVEITLAKHKERLLSVAKRYDIQDNQIVFYEEVVSGDTISERPKIKELLKKVNDGYFKGVFVVDIDRFSRGDSIDQGVINNTFYFSETLIITAEKIYDIANNEMDREQLEFKLFMSKREYNIIKKRMYQGRVDNVKAGYYVCSITPYGYTKIKEDKRGYILVPDEYEADIVKLIFKLCLDGVGTTNIAHHLNSINAKARKSPRWTSAMIRNILKNEVYYGVLKWGENVLTKKMSDGSITKKRVRQTDFKLYPGKHEPLVSKDDFDEVQEKLSPSSKKKIKKNTELKNPLAGLIHCGVCLERDKVERHMFRRPYALKSPRRAFKRKYEVDKVAFSNYMREYKNKSGLSLSEIAEKLHVSKHTVTHWFSSNPDTIYLSKVIADNWFKLKDLLNINDDTFDKVITTYEKIEPEKYEDTLLCQTPGCKNVSSNLFLVEKKLITALVEILNNYNKFVDNYEVEIKKMIKGNSDEIKRITKEIDKLNKRLDSVMEAYELKDYTREQFLKRKHDIETELEKLLAAKTKLEANKEEDKLIQIKKAIPKIEYCINNYYKCDSIVEKNDLLKSVIKRVIYTKRKGGRWNNDALNNFELKIELLFDLDI